MFFLLFVLTSNLATMILNQELLKRQPLNIYDKALHIREVLEHLYKVRRCPCNTKDVPITYADLLSKIDHYKDALTAVWKDIRRQEQLSFRYGS